MDRNPYSPPAAPLTDVARSGALYTPRQIYMASFLGSPVAAAWLMHQNFRALGDDSRALRTLWLGFAATLVVLTVAFFLPSRFPNLLFPLAYSFAIYQYALILFKSTYDKHIKDGGRRGSWWMVVGASLLADLILVGLIFGVVAAVPSLFSGR
jgi:hypothetical protein